MGQVDCRVPDSRIILIVLSSLDEEDRVPAIEESVLDLCVLQSSRLTSSNDNIKLRGQVCGFLRDGHLEHVILNL
jgi:hypothetical protein